HSWAKKFAMRSIATLFRLGDSISTACRKQSTSASNSVSQYARNALGSSMCPPAAYGMAGPLYGQHFPAAQILSRPEARPAWVLGFRYRSGEFTSPYTHVAASLPRHIPAWRRVHLAICPCCGEFTSPYGGVLIKSA